MRVATYNIHGCLGLDRRHQPARIQAVIRELDCDLLALQEVHSPAGNEDLLTRLSIDDEWSVIRGPTFWRSGTSHGNALLTRLAISKVDRIDMSVPGREPRGALHVVMARRRLTVEVLATHLGLSLAERRIQIRRALTYLKDSPPADITLLLGDLNEWLLWGRTLRWLRSHFGGAQPSPATFPACLPLLALDRIWVRPGGAAVGLTAWRTPRARVASDHLPLVAKLRMPSPK